MKRLHRLFSITAVFVLAAQHSVLAADEQNGDDDGQNNGDDGQNNGDDYADAYQQDDDMTYWTDYAIMPQKCIVYDNQDVVVFSIYEQGYKQCVNEPMGTYYTSVPRFLAAHLDQLEDNAYNEGVDYYASATAQFVECTQMVVENTEYWVQLGCNDESSQELSVNIYTDNTCTTRSTVDGYDDSNIDISGLNFNFQTCQGCVVWFDVDADNVDDGYYENHKMDSPICSSVWQYKAECDRKCQKMGKVPVVREDWQKSDAILLSALYVFGALMCFGIYKMKSSLYKDSLLAEDPTPSETPAQKYGIYVLAAVFGGIGAFFAFLKMKGLTWALLFFINFILFTFLMKFTFESGCKPCGANFEGDDDDSSDEEDDDPDTEKDSERNTGHTPPDVPPTPPVLPTVTTPPVLPTVT